MPKAYYILKSIVQKYREEKIKTTLKRELNAYELTDIEASKV